MKRFRMSAVLAASGVMFATTVLAAPAAFAGSATFTGVSSTDDPSGSPYGTHCTHGNPAVNCNAYDGKLFVWLNGGPVSAAFGDGDFFFAVVAPSGQSDPNDGAAKLLSTDPYTDRSFSVTGGVFSYTGTHDQVVDANDPNDPSGTKVRIGLVGDPDEGYLDSPNGGGVYVLMICRMPDGTQPVTSDNCKSDAFKVTESSNPGGGFKPLTATKTVTPSHERKVSWGITKSADPTLIYSGTPQSSTYTVTATKTVLDERWGISGSITVSNANADPVQVDGVADNFLTDSGLAGTTCTVAPSGGGSYTFPTSVTGNGSLSFDYSCTTTTQPDYATNYVNTADVSYTDDQAQSQTATAISDSFTFPTAATLESGSDPESVTVSDTNTATGSPGTGTVISDTTTFTYSRTFFNNLCQDYDNTASLSTGPTADATVTFCGPNAGGLTQGWWQNKNGQQLLKNNIGSACTTLNGYVNGYTSPTGLINVDGTTTKQYSTGSCSTSGTFSYLPSFDLYVFGQANSSGTGWSMLLSQWLTTTLDTASYITGKAGGPALDANDNIYNPDGLLGLDECTTIGDLLTQAVQQFSLYKDDKSTVTALSSMFDRINNNLQPSCV